MSIEDRYEVKYKLSNGAINDLQGQFQSQNLRSLKSNNSILSILYFSKIDR